MRRYNFIRVFVFLIINFCLVNILSVSAQSDAEALKLLKKSQAKFNSLKDVSVAFQKSLENGGDGKAPTKKAAGFSDTMKLKKDKYRIELGEQMIICNGKTLWHYLKTENEVTVSNYDPHEGFSPDKVFKISMNDMRARYDGAENLNGTPTEKVSMFPNSKATEYFRIEVWFEAQKHFPRRMKIFNRNGSIVSYELTDFKADVNIGDEQFTFNASAYPGVELIDNR